MDSLISFIDQIQQTFTGNIVSIYVIWSVYFLMEIILHYYESVHGLIKPRKAVRSNYALSLPLWGTAAAFIYHGALLTGNSISPFSDSPFFIILGFVVMALGVYSVIIGRIHAGGLSSGSYLYIYEEFKEFPKGGVYRKLRHPIESGHMLMSFGTFFIANSWLLLFFPLVVTIYSVYRARSVDRFYEEVIGKEYLEYEKRTGFIIPISD